MRAVYLMILIAGALASLFTAVPIEAVPGNVPEETESTYTVAFVDQNGDAVPGCVVNFCTDEMCAISFADEGGVAVFTGAPYAYHLRIIRVPEGYEFDADREYRTEAHSQSLTIALTRQ